MFYLKSFWKFKDFDSFSNKRVKENEPQEAPVHIATCIV